MCYSSYIAHEKNTYASGTSSDAKRSVKASFRTNNYVFICIFICFLFVLVAEITLGRLTAPHVYEHILYQKRNKWRPYWILAQQFFALVKTYVFSDQKIQVWAPTKYF